MAILYAGLVLGGIGLVFGLILTFASKAFHVDVDERVQQVRACCAGAICGACVEACPRSVIELLPVSQSVIVRCRNSDVARAARAVCMKACIGCGRCKKECQYDAIVVENGYARILPDKCVRCGSCAAVCPCNCITIE